ncbi:hypothetical protein OEZ85_003417 [Tetradesmus obliquus]|uniref:Tetrapyrrole biosynthesis glutamyl-tRNA reductase dimerisation domain-containing protein n=1 Tax=Tetradesmus obliquus TaxID=3088 RepID=A0ABY8UCB1_TETOB|nr:hypothetical protein OEZ85_003417 [Tetradesmus obliquus]
MILAPCRRVLSNLGFCSILSSRLSVSQGRSAVQHSFSTSSDASWESEVDTINEKFAEAREEIEFAREDAETVYFNESAEEARGAVGEVLGRWQALLARLPEDEQAKLQRAMGLKMEQLKAELKELDEMHA